MSPETIILHGREVPYRLKRSRRRTIGFAIGHDGLTVTAPQRLPHGDVEDALNSKAGWILSKLDSWAERPKPRQLDFSSATTLPWLGENIALELRPQGIRTRVTAQDGGLLVTHDPALSGDLRDRTLRSAIQRHYRREGERVMTPKIRHYADQLDKPVRKVIVRDQKRRWGSCAPDGTIRLNWRLMGFPEALIDYVCAHEAAHLVEANHSPAYWRVVEGLMPDWKARRTAMRDEADRWVAF